MAGAAANISRDFFTATDSYGWLKVQQGLPSFDAVLNYNFENVWWKRAFTTLNTMGGQYWGSQVGDQYGLRVSEQAAPSNDFDIGMDDAYLLDDAWTEYVHHPGATALVQYTSDDNYMFAGTVTSISTDQIFDTSKAFRASHYLANNSVIKMTSGAASGNTYPITAYTSTSVTATGAGAGGVLAGDTFLIKPAELTTPGGARTDDVYLMTFWDDLDETEDTDLEDPTTSLTEAHAWAQRWCIRVDEGQVGTFSMEAYWTGYTRIAEFARTASANITQAMITNDPDDNFRPLVADFMDEVFNVVPYGMDVVTVAYETDYPNNTAQYTGATALYDAVAAYASANARILVKGGGAGAYTWTSAVSVSGDLEIICVDDEVVVDHNVGTTVLATTGSGQVKIVGFGSNTTGIDFQDSGSTALFQGMISVENATLTGPVTITGTPRWDNVALDGDLTISGTLGPETRFTRCTFQGDGSGPAVNISAGQAGGVVFEQCDFDGTALGAQDGGGLTIGGVTVAAMSFRDCRFYARGAYKGIDINAATAESLIFDNIYVKAYTTYGSSTAGQLIEADLAAGNCMFRNVRGIVGFSGDAESCMIQLVNTGTAQIVLDTGSLDFPNSNSLTVAAGAGIITLNGGALNDEGSVTLRNFTVTGCVSEDSATLANANLVYVNSDADCQVFIDKFYFTAPTNAVGNAAFVGVYQAGGRLTMRDCHINLNGFTSPGTQNFYCVYVDTSTMTHIIGGYIAGAHMDCLFMDAGVLMTSGVYYQGPSSGADGSIIHLDGPTIAMISGCYICALTTQDCIYLATGSCQVTGNYVHASAGAQDAIDIANATSPCTVHGNKGQGHIESTDVDNNFGVGDADTNSNSNAGFTVNIV